MRNIPSKTLRLTPGAGNTTTCGH